MTDDVSNHRPLTDTTNDTNNNHRTNGANDPQNLNFDIHALANEMIATKWSALSMYDPEKALDFIVMAAANPNIADELPPKGLAFWRAAKFHFDLDRARAKFGLPARNATRPDPV
jgi:hypothetical protein